MPTRSTGRIAVRRKGFVATSGWGTSHHPGADPVYRSALLVAALSVFIKEVQTRDRPQHRLRIETGRQQCSR
jgi:hypothetical protein